MSLLFFLSFQPSPFTALLFNQSRKFGLNVQKYPVSWSHEVFTVEPRGPKLSLISLDSGQKNTDSCSVEEPEAMQWSSEHFSVLEPCCTPFIELFRLQISPPLRIILTPIRSQDVESSKGARAPISTDRFRVFKLFESFNKP